MASAVPSYPRHTSSTELVLPSLDRLARILPCPPRWLDWFDPPRYGVRYAQICKASVVDGEDGLSREGVWLLAARLGCIARGPGGSARARGYGRAWRRRCLRDAVAGRGVWSWDTSAWCGLWWLKLWEWDVRHGTEGRWSLWTQRLGVVAVRLPDAKLHSQLDVERASLFYARHADRSFFNSLVEYMTRDFMWNNLIGSFLKEM